MPFCPNPDCPHKKRTGNFAEFVAGIARCSDCGSPLTDVPPKEIPSDLRISDDVLKRLFFTAGMILLTRILIHIPPPGLDLSALFNVQNMNLFESLRVPQFSIGSLGIMPYISAYVVVEVFSLFTPPLKSWRAGGKNGRKKLATTARIVTICFCFIQGYGISTLVEKMTMPDGSVLVYGSGWSFRLLLILSFTAGTFVFLWIADQITEKGIGHGVSILIFAGLALQICSVFNFKLNSLPGRVPFENFLLILFGFFILFGAIALIVMMEKGEAKIHIQHVDGKSASLPLKITTAGIIPVSFAAPLIMFPSTLGNFYGFSKLTEFLAPFSVSHYLVHGIVTLFFYFLFTSFFYDPKKILDFLKRNEFYPILSKGGSFNDIIDKRLILFALCGGLYLCTYYLVFTLAIHFFSFAIGALVLMKTVAIFLDVTDEIKVRQRHNGFIKIDDVHDVTKAGFFRNILNQNGIPCFLKGYYHRGLLYFFGPYIEISLYVPEEKKELAINAIPELKHEVFECNLESSE